MTTVVLSGRIFPLPFPELAGLFFMVMRE